jgi:Transcriptional regulators
VLKIIEEMNYEPNVMARALVANKVYHIAALIPDHTKDSYWLAPREGIEKAAKDLKQFGIRIKQYIFDPFNLKSFVENANLLSRENTDGILVSPIFYHESLPFLRKWHKKKIPVILFNTQITEYDPLSYVGQDSYQSGLLAGKLIHYGQSGPCSTLIAHIDEEISNSIHLQKKEKGFGALAAEWWLCYWLYRRKIFFKA